MLNAARLESLLLGALQGGSTGDSSPLGATQGAQVQGFRQALVWAKVAPSFRGKVQGLERLQTTPYEGQQRTS